MVPAPGRDGLTAHRTEPSVMIERWHSLQPIQGRTRAARPDIVLRTSSGSAMWARVMPIRSAAPEATASSASSRVR
ncbi:hypothetical protein SHIRM173S_13381 [Streptomyces hirsutus]